MIKVYDKYDREEWKNVGFEMKLPTSFFLGLNDLDYVLGKNRFQYEPLTGVDRVFILDNRLKYPVCYTVSEINGKAQVKEMSGPKSKTLHADIKYAVFIDAMMYIYENGKVQVEACFKEVIDNGVRQLQSIELFNNLNISLLYSSRWKLSLLNAIKHSQNIPYASLMFDCCKAKSLREYLCETLLSNSDIEYVG